MKVLVTILFLLTFHYSYYQNLVPNAGFEHIINCQDLGSGISFQYASPWNGPDLGTADLFNTCSVNDDRFFVPANRRGYQYPHSGNGYAGAVFYYEASHYREYLQVKLDSDMVANQMYDVSFFVNLPSAKLTGCNNIGLYFSKTEIHTDSIPILLLLPQILEKNIITDTANWSLIGGKFVASGGERYIIIGNFFDNKNTRLSYTANASYPYLSYYFIDDGNIQRGSSSCNVDFNIQNDPSFHFLKINGPSCKSTVRIYNVLAQLLYQTSFTYSTNINVAFLPAGIYFVECQNGDQKMTKKFLKG